MQPMGELRSLKGLKLTMTGGSQGAIQKCARTKYSDVQPLASAISRVANASAIGTNETPSSVLASSTHQVFGRQPAHSHGCNDLARY
jgi:hypothetical protein